MPRKHLIASQTNKKQQSQAKLWQKLAREIRAAVKVGGPNPEANPRLKSAINKALQNNLSRDSINRNINGGNKDTEKLENLEYEAYGPNGLQIISWWVRYSLRLWWYQLICSSVRPASHNSCS